MTRRWNWWAGSPTSIPETFFSPSNTRTCSMPPATDARPSREYRQVLEKGREGKYSAFQPELAAWGLGVSLRGQREFEQAASAFDLVTTSATPIRLLIDRATVAAGEMYDTLGRRDEAIARYRKVIATGRDGDYLSAARKHLHHPYHYVNSRARSTSKTRGTA